MTIAYRQERLHAITRSFSYTDFPTSGTALNFSSAIPANAKIVDAKVRIITAFNGSSNSMSIGMTAAAANIASVAEIAAGTAGTKLIGQFMGLAPTVERTPSIHYTFIGTPTAGAGEAHIIYKF